MIINRVRFYYSCHYGFSYCTLVKLPKLVRFNEQKERLFSTQQRIYLHYFNYDDDLNIFSFYDVNLIKILNSNLKLVVFICVISKESPDIDSISQM